METITPSSTGDDTVSDYIYKGTIQEIKGFHGEVKYDYIQISKPSYTEYTDSIVGRFSSPYMKDIIPNQETAVNVAAMLLGRGSQADKEFYLARVQQVTLDEQSGVWTLLFDGAPHNPTMKVALRKATGEVLGGIERPASIDTIATEDMAIDMAISILSRGHQEREHPYLVHLDEVCLDEVSGRLSVSFFTTSKEREEMEYDLGKEIIFDRATGEVLSVTEQLLFHFSDEVW
ncbi:hypothetical protein FACS189415_1470 [Bacteroidia bacterium]|nr:hypothetical protein FACS189415_1470 [Bacteroidia bacterium]